ncbi:helicase-exonuclease AddAB subunit AddA [Clostridium sp. DL1XJH146]
MAEVKWTEDQEAAINTRGCNLLVAAAAGSGKTAVLVERIITMITDEKNPVDIDKLLIVTFTNAAASEMKERIGRAINKKLVENPKLTRLQRQLTLINKASITTIHSFCLQVIRNNFHLIEIDPNFRIGDSTETLLLQWEALDELFEELYTEENITEEFKGLIEAYSRGKDDASLKNIVMDLYKFAIASPDPEEKLISMAEQFNVDENYDFGETDWAKVILQDAYFELCNMENNYIKSVNLLNTCEDLQGYYEQYCNELNIIQDVKKASEISWEKLINYYKEDIFERLKPVRNVENKDIQEKVKKLRNKVKDQYKAIGKIISLYQVNSDGKEFRKIYPLMNELSEIVIKFMLKYKEKKKDRGIIDFSDFEHYCLQILRDKNEDGEIRPSQAAIALRERYEEILVDEYQDSNDVQEQIVNMIGRKDVETGVSNNIFMVGDVKQSIYRFREAKPELFLDKYSKYPHYKENKDDSPQKKITLYKNFRSRKEILQGINFIFEQIMSQKVGELQYTDEEALNLGASFPEFNDDNGYVGGEIELHLIDRKDEEDIISEEVIEAEDSILDDEEREELDNIQLEARLVAHRIKQLIHGDEGKKFKVYDKHINLYRDVEYKDIVILMRSVSRFAPVFVEEFRNLDIPAYSDTDAGYFETTEIKTMLALLKVIDNPRQDIPLIALLRSPIGLFNEEELVDIRYQDDNGVFYDALIKAASHAEEMNDKKKLWVKCHDIVQRIKNWRKKAKHMSVDEFIWYLYKQTGYYGYVGSMAGGNQRQANLKILFQRASQYEKTSYKGLFNFISFINKLIDNKGDMGKAKVLGENDNVVRIMTIHKSKGLEFPIVILSSLGKQFNLMDLNKKILFHNEYGYGPEFVDIERRLSYSTIIKDAVKKKIKIETLSEEMRILYVALTRAKEKLILTGSLKDLDKAIEKWAYAVEIEEDKLPEYEMLKSMNYLDWICPSLMRKKECELHKLLDNENMKLFHNIEDTSHWDIKMWKRNDIIENDYIIQEVKIEEKNSLLEVDTKIQTEVDRRLSWKYKYIKASKMPTNITVTELKKMQNREDFIEYSQNLFKAPLISKPKFLKEEEELTPAEKGTLMHLVMQKIDFLRGNNLEEIKEQINELKEKGFISEKEAQIISPNRILRFFNSNIGTRLVNSNEIYREVPFLTDLEVSEIYSDLSLEEYKDEKILLQGVIDCYFIEDNKIVILDYKTDYVLENNTQLIVDRYKEQLNYYAKAVEKITGIEVKEKYLYLFSIDKEVLI